MPRSTSNRTAFTLVELLVVVAIIALLLSILLPALGRARDVAKNVRCMAQEKQIGLAIEMYANANNDFLVPFNEQVVPNYTGDAFFWLELLVPYVSGDTRDAAGSGGWQDWHEQQIGTVWLCPDFDHWYKQEMELTPWRIGYGLSMFAGPDGASTNPWMRGLVTNQWSSSANPHYPKMMFKRVALPQPSAKVLVADCNDFNMHPTSGHNPPNNPGSAFDRHFNGGSATRVNGAGTAMDDYQSGASANFLYADGHIETHKFDEVAGNKEFFE